MAKSGTVGFRRPGMMEKQSPVIPAGDFRSVVGAYYNEEGSLTKFTGFTKQVLGFDIPSLPEAGPFTGLYVAYPSNAPSYIIGTGLTGIHRLDNAAGSWATIATGRTGTATDHYKFAMLNDTVILVNGVDPNLQTNGVVAMGLGITAPPAGLVVTPTAGGVVTPGVRQYVVTFFGSPFGTTIESNPSPTVSATFTGTNSQANLTAIPISADPQVTGRRIWRTTGGGATLRLLATINNNTATTFTDNIPDTSLGSVEVERFGYGVPPIYDSIHIFRGVLFGTPRNSSTIHFSAENKPWALHPSDNRILDNNDGDSIKAIKDLNGRIVVYKQGKNGSIWTGFGNDRLSFGFNKIGTGGFGALNHLGTIHVPGKSLLAAVERRGIRVFDGVTDKKVSDDIDPTYRKFSGGVLKNAVAISHEETNSIWWLVSDSVTQKNNKAIIWNYVQNKWAIRELPETFANVGAVITDNFQNEMMLFGGYDGRLRQESGGFSDDGAVISFSALSGPWPVESATETVKVFYGLTLQWKDDIGGANDNVVLEFMKNTEDSPPVLTRTITKEGSQKSIKFKVLGERLFIRVKHSGLRPFTLRGLQVDLYDTGRVIKKAA